MTQPLATEAPALSLEALIAMRHPSPEWATFFEVANGTGWEDTRPGRKVRRADALAFGIWASRGYAVHGFELKRSRSDWLRELADVSKADAVGAFCDRWWLVIDDAKIALDSEVPESWGILCAKRGKLAVLRDAPKREAIALTRPQIAAILRQVGETTVPKVLVEKMIAETLRDERKRAEQSRSFAEKRRAEDLAELKKHVDDFEAASGLRIRAYEGSAALGRAVAVVRGMSSVTGAERLAQAREQLLELVRFLDRDIAAGMELDKLLADGVGKGGAP